MSAPVHQQALQAHDVLVRAHRPVAGVLAEVRVQHVAAAVVAHWLLVASQDVGPRTEGLDILVCKPAHRLLSLQLHSLPCAMRSGPHLWKARGQTGLTSKICRSGGSLAARPRLLKLREVLAQATLEKRPKLQLATSTQAATATANRSLRAGEVLSSRCSSVLRLPEGPGWGTTLSGSEEECTRSEDLLEVPRIHLHTYWLRQCTAMAVQLLGAAYGGQLLSVHPFLAGCSLWAAPPQQPGSAQQAARLAAYRPSWESTR